MCFLHLLSITRFNTYGKTRRLINGYLVSIDEEDFVHGEREEHIQEEDLVAPDDSLFLGLLMEPARPLILHQLILKAIFLRHEGDKFLPCKETEIERDIKMEIKMYFEHTKCPVNVRMCQMYE